MASPDDHPDAPAANPTNGSDERPAAAASTCPRCGANGASFSKSQWRKRPAERKCRACVEAVLGGPSLSPPPQQPSLTAEAAPSSQPRRKRKRGRGGDANTAAGEELSPGKTNNAQPDEKEGQMQEEESKDDRKKSKYFPTKRPTKGEENSPDVQSSSSSSEEEEFDDEVGPAERTSKTGSGDGEPGMNDDGSKFEGSDDDAPGKWSPLVEAEEAEDASADGPNNGHKTNNVRHRMKRARERALGDSQQHHESENDNDDDKEAREESLEAIKRQILGRPVRSMYDVDPTEEATAAASSSQGSRLVMNVNQFADGATVADRLRHDLSCPICHDRLHRPVSLLCGHSFCRACVAWWLARTAPGGDEGGDSDDGGSGDERGASSEGKGGTCPTCREPLPSRMASATDNDDENSTAGLRVNTALQAVTEALYGAELHQRRLVEARDARKARSGERDGMHDRGCEEVEALPDEDELDCLRDDATDDARDGANDWRALYSTSDRPGWREGRSSYHRGGGATILIRRNVVLDENDQRYQLSLGMTRCAYLPGRSGAGVVDVQLCLLAMEEDEVDDSGFPAFVADGDDDEALICAGNERVHTLVEASARIVPASALKKDAAPSAMFGGKNDDGAAAVRDLPLSRGMIGRDGAVRFRIDVGKALEGESGGAEHGEEMRLVKLRFRHADTGAVLELRLPSEREREALRKGNADDEIEFGGVRVPAARDGAARYAMDDRAEDEEDDAPNEYEEDGFLVHGSQDSEEEELGSDDEGHPDDDEDDDGQCEICDNGGDLLVCDGAGRGGGCGRMYHVQCIGRTEIPPGDWICNSCAYGIGISVGLEGHEFEPDDGEGVEPATDEPLVVDDSDDDEDEVENDVQAIDAATNDNALVIDDSDDEVVPVQKKGGKRKILEMPESDSDSE